LDFLVADEIAGAWQLLLFSRRFFAAFVDLIERVNQLQFAFFPSNYRPIVD
jgi:hypothetical protein